ncbi:MAG: hypothetical protein ACFFH0_12305 [Promethearchaeota archaeon]
MIVGTDIGYYATKATTVDKRITFLSAVGTPEKARVGLQAQNSIILLRPKHVQIGESAVLQSRFLHRREDRKWIESEEWYLLFLAAMTELFEADATVKVYTGLPVAFYLADKDFVRDRLTGDHTVQREGREPQTITVSECLVTMQPYGTLCHKALNEDGLITDVALATGRAGVLDIGSHTSNFFSSYKLSDVNIQTDSIQRGAWDAVRDVRAWLSDNCPDLDLRGHEVVDAITNRSVKYYGETVDLTEIVEETLGDLAEDIITTATQLWNGGASLDRIFVTGGGAILLGEYIQRAFAHSEIVSDAVFANADGYLRFGTFLNRAGAQ